MRRNRVTPQSTQINKRTWQVRQFSAIHLFVFVLTISRIFNRSIPIYHVPINITILSSMYAVLVLDKRITKKVKTKKKLKMMFHAMHLRYNCLLREIVERNLQGGIRTSLFTVVFYQLSVFSNENNKGRHYPIMNAIQLQRVPQLS